MHFKFTLHQNFHMCVGLVNCVGPGFGVPFFHLSYVWKLLFALWVPSPFLGGLASTANWHHTSSPCMWCPHRVSWCWRVCIFPSGVTIWMGRIQPPWAAASARVCTSLSSFLDAPVWPWESHGHFFPVYAHRGSLQFLSFISVSWFSFFSLICSFLLTLYFPFHLLVHLHFVVGL